MYILCRQLLLGIIAALEWWILFTDIIDLCSNVCLVSLSLYQPQISALPAAAAQQWCYAREWRGCRPASECAAGNAGTPRRPLHDCVSTLPPASAPERVVTRWRRPGRARRLRSSTRFSSRCSSISPIVSLTSPNPGISCGWVFTHLFSHSSVSPASLRCSILALHPRPVLLTTL